ncbi:hypothetical protein [Nocardia sp. NPDC051570]|uniref:hypothetical protein n=1 Tax=Nocardia sp. NPDC051570 TaxID=3364324 RepID=UPI0037A86870
MAIAGHIIELIGAFLTALGLALAWKRAGQRAEKMYRALITKILSLLRGHGDPVPIGAHDTITVSSTATVLKQYVLLPDPTDHLGRLLDAINELSRDLDRVERTQLSTAGKPDLTSENISRVAGEMLVEFQGELETRSVKDLRWAFIGIAITIIGLAVGICAEILN